MDIAEIDRRHQALPVALRAKYLHIGRQFGSRPVLAQLNRVLNALVVYREVIADHGFGADDEAAVLWVRDGEVAAGAERSEAQVGRKVTNVELRAAEADAQKKRKGARALLRRVPEKLVALDTEASKAAAQDLEVVLNKTRATGDDAEAQAVQLDMLARVLTQAEVVGLVGAERAALRAAACQKAAAALRAAAAKHSRPQGTPEETQRLDLLDGEGVILARHARAAAMAAAEELEDPAIAKAFELVELG